MLKLRERNLTGFIMWRGMCWNRMNLDLCDSCLRLLQKCLQTVVLKTVPSVFLDVEGLFATRITVHSKTTSWTSKTSHSRKHKYVYPLVLPSGTFCPEKVLNQLQKQGVGIAKDRRNRGEGGHIPGHRQGAGSPGRTRLCCTEWRETEEEASLGVSLGDA